MALGGGRPQTGGRPQAVRSTAQAKAPTGGQRISNHPADAEVGTGAPDNVDVEILACDAVSDFTYNGTLDTPISALKVLYGFGAWDGRDFKRNGQEHEQHYSAGELTRLLASDDGSCFIAAEGSSVKGLNDNSNLMMYLNHLIEHGFPDDERLDDYHNLVGLVGHLSLMAPAKKREGLEGGNKPISCFNKIHRMPWEGKGKAVAARAAAAAPAPARSTAPPPQPATNGAEVEDLNTASVNAVVTLLADKQALPVKTLGMEVFKSIPTDPRRAAILKHISTKDFLAQEGLPFAVDGDSVVLAG